MSDEALPTSYIFLDGNNLLGFLSRKKGFSPQTHLYLPSSLGAHSSCFIKCSHRTLSLKLKEVLSPSVNCSSRNCHLLIEVHSKEE